MRREAAMTGDKTSVFADDWSGEMGQRWLRNVDPVSYTHLDVYKRQILNSQYRSSLT